MARQLGTASGLENIGCKKPRFFRFKKKNFFALLAKLQTEFWFV